MLIKTRLLSPNSFSVPTISQSQWFLSPNNYNQASQSQEFLGPDSTTAEHLRAGNASLAKAQPDPGP